MIAQIRLRSKSFTPAPIVIKQKRNRQLVRGFTLMELMLVIVIISILTALGLAYYGPYKEGVLDKEAKANLRLIIVAQRDWRMDKGGYYPLISGTINDIGSINSKLRLLLPNPANPADRSWDYMTKSNNSANPPTACAEATRNDGSSTPRKWKMLYTGSGSGTGDDSPVAGGC